MASIDSVAALQTYYGHTLQSSADLRTSACCISEAISPLVSRAIARVNDSVKDRFYGCGSPIPPALDGITVLDLGCGTGRDCYVFSQLVGCNGRVIGVDMTEEQIRVAKDTLEWHAQMFGYANVEFKLGRIEDLVALGIADNSVDLVVSNCVLNLSTDKRLVMKEIFRVLKPGGELYFSDIFSDRRIPSSLLHDPVLHGECLAGAWYVEDFRRMLDTLGCADSRTVSCRPVNITDPDIQEKIGFANFTSRTVRAFKLPLEDRCEDFGQAAVYRGGIAGQIHSFTLDLSHTFPRGKAVAVCGNIADMLSATRYAHYFTIIGGKETHYGLFPNCKPEQLALDGDSSCC